MGLLSEIIENQKRLLNAAPVEMCAGHENNFRQIGRNLITDMAAEHYQQYEKGSGGELTGDVAKMASVRSSSAMTFNLLGNYAVRMRKDNVFGFAPGDYKVEYEKQLYTLGCNGNPANFDAYLSRRFYDQKGEAIFCEMKMVEWLSTGHSDLDEKYNKAEHYFAHFRKIQVLKTENQMGLGKKVRK